MGKTGSCVLYILEGKTYKKQLNTHVWDWLREGGPIREMRPGAVTAQGQGACFGIGELEGAVWRQGRHRSPGETGPVLKGA